MDEAIELYNEYRSPMAIATLLSQDKNAFQVRFSGPVLLPRSLVSEPVRVVRPVLVGLIDVIPAVEILDNDDSTGSIPPPSR